MRIYAVKYVDEHGYTLSYGYIKTMQEFSSGDIIAHGSQRIKIDFEVKGEVKW